jgi:hypothetical protein
MAVGQIVLSDAAVHILDLEIAGKDIADFLRRHDEAERELVLARAIEVGVFCLERAASQQDTEFVRRQVDSLLTAVERQVGAIPQHVEAALLAKVGTGNGQVLAPIQTLVDRVVNDAKCQLTEIKQLVREVDPRVDGSAVGSALRQVREMLDPKRTDSVQTVLEKSIRDVATTDGAMAQAVRSTIEQALSPLKERVEDLTKEIRGRDAAAEALAQTTAKGTPYEDEVATRLCDWAKQVGGVTVRHVGADNRPGDVVVEILASSPAATPFRLVVEVRDRQQPKGHKAISDDLQAAMSERHASVAIYVSRYRDGLANEIGEWAEGQCKSGPYVACLDDYLQIAVRFLIIQKQLAERRAAAYEIDAGKVAMQLRQIRTALARVTTINNKVTGVVGNAFAIQMEATSLRTEISSAITAIEDAVRLYPSAEPTALQEPLLTSPVDQGSAVGSD